MKDRTGGNSPKAGNGARILVAYASPFGSTAEVAEAIGEALRHDGASVETKPIESVKDLRCYDAVIVGSAIRYDRWMPEATEFVTANRGILSELPVAFFFSCLTLSSTTEKARRKAMGYSDALCASHAMVNPVDVGRFAGVLDYSKMPFFSRFAARIIMAFFRVREGDYRDWSAIRRWAGDIDFKLSAHRKSPPVAA